jgi:hypothetical protein
LPPALDHERRSKVLSENARALYRLP